MWSELGSGTTALNANNEILSTCTDPTGNIYAVGAFTDGTTSLTGHQYVAKWDGATWSKVGTGSNALDTNSSLSSICSDVAGNIYVAGIATANGWQVAKWNGTTWGQLGTGSSALNANSWFSKMCIDGSGNIYVAGNFTDSSGNCYVAKWNGTAWTELGGGLNGSITSICLDGSGNVYAPLV